MSRSSFSDHEMYGGDGHVGHTTTPGFSNPTPPPAQPYVAPYVVQCPGGTIRWSTGLCHCTDDPANCKYPKIHLPVIPTQNNNEELEKKN